MDPITQAALGAALAQSVIGERLGRRAWWLGALGGMAPDLDVLIRSAGNPLLELEFHRHFTHSLAFIPIGGLLVALPFLLRERGDDSRRQRAWILAATTLGWATHGLLDATTSYGTMLWWPFSHQRVAWNFISVIDPIYTLALIVGVVVAARRTGKLASDDPALRRRVRMPALIGLLVASLYMLLGVVQHARADASQRALAHERGHTIVHARVDTFMFTNLLWRSTYLDDQGSLHADTIALPWWASARVHAGASTPALLLAPDWPSQAPTQRERDLGLFAWFADGLLYVSPEDPREDPPEDPRELGRVRICDGRYSAEPGEFDGMFCVWVGPEGVESFERNTPRDAGRYFARMAELIAR
ncbi:metal-dependent hydrolase [Nannocystaceae bacterium ST9]